MLKLKRNKKVAADASLLNKALALASEIDVPAESLLKESTAKNTQKVVELAEDLQGLVNEETGEPLKAPMEV